MIIPAAKIYTVKLHQRLFNQKVLNVFHYNSQELPPSPPSNDHAQALFVAFMNTVIPAMIACQSEDLKVEYLEVYNAIVYPDRYEGIAPYEGLISIGGSDSSFVAFGFKMVRKYNHTRNGSKRFAGVPDNYMVANEYTGATGVLENLANVLGQSLLGEESNVTPPPTFTPCIVHRTQQIPFEIEYGNEVNHVMYTGITTQVSRKKGRGI